MKELSILDKLKVLFDITMSDKTYFIIMGLLAFLSILFATTNRKNAKESKTTYGIIYLVAIIAVIIKYHSSLSTMYDAMMNNLFIVFFFPNISVYLAAIITTNIIMWVSMFSKKTKRITKIVNSIAFFLMHYILVLNLGLITNEKLDVFDSVSLYSNQNVHSLIELSSNIFIVWVIYLILYKILMNYFENKREKTEVVHEVVKETVKTVPYYVNNINSSKNKFLDSIREIDSPIIIKRDEHRNGTMDKINTLHAPYVVKNTGKVQNYDYDNIKILQSPVVVKQNQKSKIVYTTPSNPNTGIYEPNLSQEDYKVVLSLLREQKEKEKINKEQKRKIQKDNEDKLSQLMELYRVV